MAGDLSLWWLVPVAAAQAAIGWRRLLAYLRYLQQEGYEPLRFLRWSGVQSLTDPAFWLSIVAVWVSPVLPLATVLFFVAGSSLLAAGQPDPRRSGKIPLKMTWRARRVAAVAAVWALLLWLFWGVVAPQPGFQAIFGASAVVLAAMPLVLITAVLWLGPYERYVQRVYELDAVDVVRRVRPFIIGITGSYGKSSTKSMLAHILQFSGPTLSASGSINTLMGITRHIRENLVFGHRFMVVEMGAFKTGSIRRLCRLTPPSAAIITAVGDMHLERFGSLDEIVRAKRELAEALPPGGLLVVNADSPGALRIAKRSPDRRVLLYGETSDEVLDTRLESVQFSKQGTSFVLRTATAVHSCFTPLLGRPIILNVAGAFTLAAALGLDPAVIIAALRTLKPVSNRLEVVEEGGIGWIRDAYNSNQIGFRAALEVAAALPVERRFMATPGVIELGPQQFEVNRALSREASAVCDRTIVVSDTNRAAFAAGHRDAGLEDRLVTVETRTEAFRWLNDTLKPGDIVILENDLPDLYERSEGLFWRDRSGANGGFAR
jgi:UDP-N-acetylmuramoyl-tripeptide--D-alanyl-D-alanine ligase